MPPRVLRLLLALLALTPLGGRAARAQDAAGTGAWEDPAVLERHLGAALDAVEQACGVRFARRPTVRVSTQADVEAIVASCGEGQQGLAESPAEDDRTYLAYYDPAGYEIHLLPGAVREVAETFRTPEVLDEDVLRVVLVHEATHALDYQRFPVRWALACCGEGDERLACEAVLEGHAQLVAEEVAARWGIPDAFARLTRMYAGVCPRRAEEDLPFDAEGAFVYLQGHAFLRAVAAVGGRRAVDGVLARPPFETRVVDRPILWIRPEMREREPDLPALLEAFRPLAVPGWEVRKWRVLGPPACAFGALDGRGAGSFVERYVDNHSLYAASADGTRYVSAFVALCATDAAAAELVSDLAALDRGRDGEQGWEPPRRERGAGPGGRLPGFCTERRAIGGADPPLFSLQVARIGRYVFELTQYGAPDAGRAAQDTALDVASRMLAAPPASAAAVALRSHVLAFLGARERGDLTTARALLADLLPTDPDVRRVLAPASGASFVEAYGGPRLATRGAAIPDETVRAAFRGLEGRSRVLAWAATTGDLAAGRGRSDRFPAAMRAFAREHAAPGITWLVLEGSAPGRGSAERYACFARVGDRFVWIAEPWTAVR